MSKAGALAVQGPWVMGRFEIQIIAKQIETKFRNGLGG
jgi:hypothetical protein